MKGNARRAKGLQKVTEEAGDGREGRRGLGTSQSALLQLLALSCLDDRTIQSKGGNFHKTRLGLLN